MCLFPSEQIDSFEWIRLYNVMWEKTGSEYISLFPIAYIKNSEVAFDSF